MTKAVKAMLAAGLPVARAEIATDGAIIIFTAQDDQRERAESNEWVISDDKT